MCLQKPLCVIACKLRKITTMMATEAMTMTMLAPAGMMMMTTMTENMNTLNLKKHRQRDKKQSTSIPKLHSNSPQDLVRSCANHFMIREVRQ